jgi:hypothetical protein
MSDIVHVIVSRQMDQWISSCCTQVATCTGGVNPLGYTKSDIAGRGSTGLELHVVIQKGRITSFTHLNHIPPRIKARHNQLNQKSKPLVSHTSRSCHLTSAASVCKKIKPSKPATGNHDTRNEGAVVCDTTLCAMQQMPLCFCPFFHHVFFMPSFMLPFVLASISRSSVLVSTKNICQLHIPSKK